MNKKNVLTGAGLFSVDLQFILKMLFYDIYLYNVSIDLPEPTIMGIVNAATDKVVTARAQRSQFRKTADASASL